MQVQEDRVTVEEPMVDPEQRARQRSKKTDRQLRMHPPRQNSAVDQDATIPIVDEIVQVERIAGRGERALDHRSVDVIVQQRWRSERR